jgi:hypothetical protein
MGSIAAASVQNSTAQIQQAAQIDLLKKATDNDKEMAARLLASAQVVTTAPGDPSGRGQLIDRRA